MRASGIQSEVVVSLAVVMVTATTLLMAFFFRTHTSLVESLRGPLIHGLQAEVEAPTFGVGVTMPGVEWWQVSAAGEFQAVSGGAAPGDESLRRLVEQARLDGASALWSRAPWDPIRFAVPIGGGTVAVAQISPVVSRGAIFTLMAVDIVVFCVFGSYLLRRRIISPLRTLALAAHSIRESGPGARVLVEGVEEVEEVALAFNEMSEALEQRTGALEKAVTDLRQANAHLTQARDGLIRGERLAAVGGLAAGVAHEVGNPMGALLAFLDLAGRDDRIGEDGRAHLRKAAEQGDRVREILRQLLDFSRPPQARARPVDVVAVARQIEGLVGAQPRYSGIALEVLGEGSLPQVTSDESMLSQILLNLVLNAADALRGSADARIRMRVRKTVWARRASDRSGDRPSGRRRLDAIEVEISDSGPGIAAGDRDRIFDPFYTTKPPGEGTGLGLANAQRLAEEIGGRLELRDEHDLCGACFALILPIEAAGASASSESADDARQEARAVSPECRTP